MVIHPNAGWAGVIWGRGEGGKGVGEGGRVAAGGCLRGLPSVPRTNTIKKNRNRMT